MKKNTSRTVSEPERIGIGTIFVAVFMLSSLILLADSLWPSLIPDKVEFVVIGFIGIVAGCAPVAMFACEIISLKRQAEARHPRPECIGIGRVFVAVFILSCLILLAHLLWPFLPDKVAFVIGTFFFIVVICVLAAKWVLDTAGSFGRLFK